MIHYILKDSIFILIDGKPISITKDSNIFKDVKELLIKKDFNKIETLILNKSNNNFNLIIKDGSYYFKDIQIPNFISEFLNKNEKKGKALINLWLNIRKKHDEKTIYNICQELIKKDFFPLTEDGFYIGYEEKNKEDSFLSNNNNKEVFFYNISSLPSYIYSLIKGNSIESLIESMFGSNSSRLLKIIKEKSFQKDSNHIEYCFLIYGIIFKNILNEENLIKFLENSKRHDITISKAKLFNQFLKEISLEKDNKTINQKKVMNFIETVSWLDMNSFLDYYDLFKNRIGVSLKDLKLKNNFFSFYHHFSNECSIFKDTEIFNLDIKDNFPDFYKINRTSFEEFIIVFPETNKDLVLWSNTMGNCIKSFSKDVKEGNCLVLSLVNKKSNKMVYNVEITNGIIRQFEKIKKTPPDKELRLRFKKFLIEKGLIYKT